MSNEETKGRLILIIRKRQLTFLGHVMKKEVLRNLTLTEYVEGLGDIRKFPPSSEKPT